MNFRQRSVTQLTQFLILGLHRLRYDILAALRHGWLQFGEFSVKRDCAEYQWHPQLQRASFSSNIHNKLGTVVVTVLPAYITWPHLHYGSLSQPGVVPKGSES